VIFSEEFNGIIVYIYTGNLGACPWLHPSSSLEQDLGIHWPFSPPFPWKGKLGNVCWMELMYLSTAVLFDEEAVKTSGHRLAHNGTHSEMQPCSESPW